MNQKCKVSIRDKITEESEVRTGVRQGCCISPILLTFTLKKRLTNASGEEEGIRLGAGGFKLHNLQFKWLYQRRVKEI